MVDIKSTFCYAQIVFHRTLVETPKAPRKEQNKGQKNTADVSALFSSS